MANQPVKKGFRELYLYPKDRKTRMQMQFDKVFGRTKEKPKAIYELRTLLNERVPRKEDMRPDMDWPNAWPTAQSFRSSVVPLPLRMGFRRRLDKPPPSAYGNLELVKIPNFLHLTPAHIQKHCEAIKKFCTKFPEPLKHNEIKQKYFPVELQYSDFVHQGNNIRDIRARVNTLQIKLSSFGLDTHAHNKMRQLVGDRYSEETDLITIVADRCPTRAQNRDYLGYLLTALYHESNKTEPWEANFVPELLALKEAERQSREHSDLECTGKLMVDGEEFVPEDGK